MFEIVRRALRGTASVCALACAAAVLAACGGEEDDGRNLLVVSNTLGTPAGVKVTAIVSQPGRVKVLTHDEITGSPTLGAKYAQVRTQKSGTLSVTILATTVPSDTIGYAVVNMPLVDGHEYHVSVTRRPAGYNEFCFGCIDLAKVPLRGSARNTTDSLWINYGGRLYCRDCVY